MNGSSQPALEAGNRALDEYQILGSSPEASFDELARLAAQLCGARIALIGFLDGERLWIKSRFGCTLPDLSLADALCQATLEAQFPVVVHDAVADTRFRDSILVKETPNVRLIAAALLVDKTDGGARPAPIGILCAMDGSARVLSAEQIEGLGCVARQVMAQLELRKKHRTLEVALRRSEAFYHSLVETIPQNIFRKDTKGRFTFANSRFCETVKRPLAQIIGKTDFDLFPPELAAKYQHDDKRVLETREPLRAIEQHRDTNGETLYVQVIKSPLWGREGELAGVQGIFWDETERYKAEEALAYERDLLRAMLDNIPDSIYFKDRYSRFLAISRSLAIRLGLNDPAEAVGKTDREFFGPRHAEEALRDELEIIRTGQPLVAKTEREVWLDGRERWVLTTKVPLRNRQSEIIGTFGISKDITDLKNVESELSKARDAALESARLKSEFLANMSHEIRTPLNAVIGMTGLLLDTSLSEDQRDFAGTIRQSADTLLDIINDLLDFSKIEAGKMAIETIDFDLNDVVEGIMELLAESALMKEIELASWIHEEVPRHLRGDPGRLRQVLTNLVGNAVKFTEKGEVVLEAARLRESERNVLLKFTVRDTGIGVPYEAQNRLFQAFVQADGSTTRRYGGTGLGLAISKQLVELMGGQIGFESVPDKGSNFWFTVPLEKQSEPERLPPAVSTLEGVRILVVDDNRTNREIVHHQVLSWKMRNGSAHSGKAALETLEGAAESGDPFDIAILDMQMPEMDGLSLARAIKANPKIASTRLVMLTSLGFLPEERKWHEAGIAAYLIKPVKETRLYETLISVLRGSAMASRNKAVAHPAPDPSRRSIRVLVAEDNVVNQKVAVRQLQKLGYSADAVANGLEVLEAVKRIPYDIVLMDCQMPELDGYEATRLIRSEEHSVGRGERRLYIIAMTANAFAGDREECISAGMDDYISKPVRTEELDAAIARGLKSLSACGDDSEILDQETLRTVRDLRSPGDPDPLAELIDLFLADTPPRISRILDAFKAGDAAALEGATHSLKGSASNIGAKCLANACRAVLDIAREGKLPDAAAIAKVLSEFDRLKPALEREKDF